MLYRAVLTLLVGAVVAFPTPQGTNATFFALAFNMPQHALTALDSALATNATELAQVSGVAPDTFLAEFDASVAHATLPPLSLASGAGLEAGLWACPRLSPLPPGAGLPLPGV